MSSTPSYSRETLKSLQLLNAVNVYQGQKEFFSELNESDALSGTKVISFLNAHAVNLAHNDQQFTNNLIDSDFLLRDGVGVEIGMKMLGLEPGENLNGTDLIPQILRQDHGQNIAVLGTEEPFLSRACEKLTQEYGVNIVAQIDGFKDDEDYLAAIKALNVKLIVLAMGMPKQEHVAILLKKSLQKNITIVNGGAILDFLAARFERVPLIIQKLKIEWIYRLLQEPKRLWKRYLLGNFIYLYRVTNDVIVKKISKA